MRVLPAVLTVSLIVILFGVLLLSKSSPPKQLPIDNPIPSPSAAIQDVDFQATFTIITDNITRSFKNPKYHNKSPDVFITLDNPSVVNVKKAGITWGNFFDTLPMKLTKDCLITGDGERLCDNENGSLKFYLNETEDKNLLNKKIQNNDQALI